ncbi:hypothetical protein GCM10010341_90010 [Streptomyces noursei]|nr:hypothetical protein GCM10010341_90010 [Streptomyces noursei]
MRNSSDLIAIGAGVVGAACSYYAARPDLRVTVLDRGPVAGGTTGAGEGNLLVADKEPGPELQLALHSLRLWRELAEELPAIGPDPRRPGLLHACGHEGAGIGLAPATGRIVAAILTGDQLPLDITPFRPERFDGGAER